MKYRIFLFLVFVLNISAFSQTAWTAKPFDPKVFIKNKGQFDGKNGNNSKILFSASSDGVDLYFTSNGLTYKHDEKVELTKKEKREFEKINSIKEDKENEEEDEDKKFTKSVPHYLSIEWLGSNPNAEIISEQPASFYYTYGDGKSSPQTSIINGKDIASIKAGACKKIIYKNLYPNIDVEYVFPEDKPGIKYNVILHPGADIRSVQMKYSGAKKLALAATGDITIGSDFGDFTDHAPVAYYAGGEKIGSGFKIQGDKVSFDITVKSSCHLQSTIIIDPWTTNPAFTGYNIPYDLNYDLNGNVYVYGSGNPYKLAKLNSAGVVQWVFNASGMNGSWYGDFALDEVSGTSYIVQGDFPGTAIYKVNSLGVQTGSVATISNFPELFRAEYNRCINKIVIAGGSWSSPDYEASMLDTNLTTLSPVSLFGLHNDLGMLTLDNNSNYCYIAGTEWAGNAGNKIVKCPIPSLMPSVFSVSNGHKFQEAYSVSYYTLTSSYANGMNGMAVSPSWLYTYDGDSLKRWDKNSGTYISGIHASPIGASYGGSNQILISWGGLAVDECDNIYTGVQSSIKEYNSSYALVNTFALPDNVYDLKKGLNNKLYACGRGYVTEITLPSNNTSLTLTSTPSGCNVCDGTATVSSVSCGNLSGFNYSWNTNPVQNTQTATGLCAGNYVVTVSTNCFQKFIDSITVLGGGLTQAAFTYPLNSYCKNSVNPTPVYSGTGNFSSSPAGLVFVSTTTGQINLSASTAGTYTVTNITPASGPCAADTATFDVSIVALPVIMVSSATICAGDTAHLSATGGATYVWSAGATSTGTTTADASPVATTSYTVTGINSGCSDSAIATVTVVPLPVVTVNLPSICAGKTANLTANGATSYTWSAGAISTGTSTADATPVLTTTYTVTGTNNGCSDTAHAVVTVISLPTITVNSSTICYGETANLIANGGTTYTWSAGATSTGVNTADVSPLLTATYTVTGTANGCPNTAVSTVTVIPLPIANAGQDITVLTGSSTKLHATGGGPYSWSPATGLSCSDCQDPVATVTETTTYCVTITDVNGCSDSACVTVIVDPRSTIFIPNAFTPDNNNLNDVFKPELINAHDYKFLIYNRWGEKIFETTNMQEGWNGTYKGARCEQDTYAYKIVFKDDFKNSLHQYIGKVTLIR